MAVILENKYLLHIKKIDDQHKGLFKIVSDLFDAIDYTDKQMLSFMPSFIECAQKYMLEHFETEESLMRETGYPCILDHIQKHRDFETEISKITSEYNDKGSLDILKVSRYMYKWTIEHIGMIDKEFGNYYREYKNT